MSKQPTTHTPGPWTQGHVKGSACYDIIGPDLTGKGREIVGSFRASQYPNDVNDANARLIAAAPRLLALVEALLRAPSVGSAGPGSTTIVLQDLYRREAEAVLSEIEGG